MILCSWSASFYSPPKSTLEGYCRANPLSLTCYWSAALGNYTKFSVVLQLKRLCTYLIYDESNSWRIMMFAILVWSFWFVKWNLHVVQYFSILTTLRCVDCHSQNSPAPGKIYISETWEKVGYSLFAFRTWNHWPG